MRLGRGGGDFAPATRVTDEGPWSGLVVGDLDGDGRGDVVSAAPSTDTFATTHADFSPEQQIEKMLTRAEELLA